jgi:alkylation response protein AidB-like acyl-CoA dehydrogenase
MRIAASPREQAGPNPMRMARDGSDRIQEQLGELTEVLRATALEADRRARLPETVVRTLQELHLFRLWIPRSYGGLELALPDTLQIYESAARIDGSVGWAVMIGAGGGLFAAYLEPETAAAIFAPDDAVIAGSGAPEGHAERTAGGYRVTGRWRFASGADYATTFTANCVVTDGGRPLVAEEGEPLIRAMAFTPSQVAIVPTWDSSGMRGTGSHDIEVRDVFVPEERSFSVFTDPPLETGPLYRVPFLTVTELSVAAVALGIARHALDAFGALARRKKSLGSDQTLAEDTVVQARYAESHARWRLAQAGLATLASQAWEAALTGRPSTPDELAEVTASCAACVSALRGAVDDLAGLAGMTAIAVDDELARAWRDLQAVGAHVAVAPRQLAPAGAVLLGRTAP